MVYPREERIDSWLAQLPEPLNLLGEQLRSVIHAAIPPIEEKLQYGIPFFHDAGRLCYILHEQQGNRLLLGFSRGHELADPWNKLEAGDRQQIRHWGFQPREEVDTETLRVYLQEAALLNEARRARRKAR